MNQMRLTIHANIRAGKTGRTPSRSSNMTRVLGEETDLKQRRN